MMMMMMVIDVTLADNKVTKDAVTSFLFQYRVSTVSTSFNGSSRNAPCRHLASSKTFTLLNSNRSSSDHEAGMITTALRVAHNIVKKYFEHMEKE